MLALTEAGSLDPLLYGTQAEACALDQEADFPAQAIFGLRQAGTLGAAFDEVPALLGTLRRLGAENLSVGRLFEAHVNACLLAVHYGSPAVRERVAEDRAAGHLFGLWVTDAGPVVVLDQEVLRGSKGPCSGAGHVTRAVITVDTPEGIRMAVVETAGLEVRPLGRCLTGMRGSVNGIVKFDGARLPHDALFGQPGDYLREPMLSTGAWRTSAVTLGGLDALVEATRTQLLHKGQDASLLQQDRFGRLCIAQDTAWLWTEQAAHRACDETRPVADRVADVNLARIAVETACLEAMQLVQRALGLSAFVRPNPVEQILRDLAVYLRQPAPDAVLTEAGFHRLHHP